MKYVISYNTSFLQTFPLFIDNIALFSKTLAAFMLINNIDKNEYYISLPYSCIIDRVSQVSKNKQHF